MICRVLWLSGILSDFDVTCQVFSFEILNVLQLLKLLRFDPVHVELDLTELHNIHARVKILSPNHALGHI